MENIILIFCATFLLTLLIYWIMPIKKMTAVNEALKTLLQILPISKAIEVVLTKNTDSNEGK